MSRNRSSIKTNVDIKYTIDVAKIIQSLTVAVTILTGLLIQGAKADPLSLDAQTHSQNQTSIVLPWTTPTMVAKAQT